jgi:hypothetical protein
MEVPTPRYFRREKVIVKSGRSRLTGVIASRLYDIDRMEWMYRLFGRDWDLYPESAVKPLPADNKCK